jgi:tetratricopeptide (TPR) repeat protein
MKLIALLWFACMAIGVPAFGDAQERLGTVTFATSCSAPLQSSINRGVALLHDFWYEEAQRQFEQIVKADPGCSIAHWGVAMSQFHQIWNRPGEDAMARGRAELAKAQSGETTSDREREYIAALTAFYHDGKEQFPARVSAYSAAMSKLYARFPEDVDAGAFYALSLLAAKDPKDTGLAREQQALAVLNPLFARYPDHPGLVHYIIHACDNPAMAAQGLTAAERYGKIAPSGAHAVHMPGHIFARLGMWQADIEVNRASVAAAQKALVDHSAAIMDQLHAQDFLLYAYLQSGQEEQARQLVGDAEVLFAKHEAMGRMAGMDMSEMIPAFRTHLPLFFNLERRDWKAAAALQPLPGAPADVQLETYWARSIANGHLRHPAEASADLKTFHDLLDQVRKGKHAFIADSAFVQVLEKEVGGWTAFAQGDEEKAISNLRSAAELQDKVGQAEVDIPAREMTADMLLDLRQPEKALIEYDLALQASPNRFNSLFHAGQAAEATGDKARAAKYYSKLMEVTGSGAGSSRPEFAHVRSFLASEQATQE